MNDHDGSGEFKTMGDGELLREIRFLADRARHNELRLLRCVAEFDDRRLCIKEGYRSLYEYCIHALGFDDNEAFRRIRAARVILKHPAALMALEKKKISISALVVLSPWLDKENETEWLKTAEGKTRRELEALIAARYPQAPMPDDIRHLPTKAVFVSQAPPAAVESFSAFASPQGSGTEGASNAAAGEAIFADPSSDGRMAPPEWPAIAAGAPERLDRGWQVLAVVAIDRVRIGFDAAAALAGLIDRARQVLRHKYPEGRLEDVFRDALEIFLDRKDPQRKFTLKLDRPASTVAESGASIPERLPDKFLRAWSASRYVPAKVKSAVWQRDGGRCAWRESDGTVCGCQDNLEYDHIRPFSKGGRSDDSRNIRLLCGEHNQAAARAAGLAWAGAVSAGPFGSAYPASPPSAASDSRA